MTTMDPVPTISSNSRSQPTQAITTSTFVERLRDVFLKSQTLGEPSFHDKALKLPYYNRLLQTHDITAKELLLKFVNDSAIFLKFETIVKTNSSYQKIFSKELYLHEQVEKDINFFIKQFGLDRPAYTKETQEYLNFIDSTVAENNNFLAILLFVQYGGLFLGRMIATATKMWLMEKVQNWNTLPFDKRGLSYWNFRGKSQEELEPIKKKFIEGINSYESLLPQSDKVHEITKNAFFHIFNCDKSASLDGPSQNISTVSLSSKNIKVENNSKITDVILISLIAIGVFFLFIQKCYNFSNQGQTA